MWAFSLLRGASFFKTTLRFALYGIMACIVPALWYVAAYKQGGDAFLALVIEENFGRMMGKMSYDSHIHPFTYNFTSLLAGWLPYTLLALIGLFFAPWRDGMRRLKVCFKGAKGTQKVTRLLEKAKKADPVELFSWLSFGLILLFFCFPSSKRSDLFVALLSLYGLSIGTLCGVACWRKTTSFAHLYIYNERHRNSS